MILRRKGISFLLSLICYFNLITTILSQCPTGDLNIIGNSIAYVQYANCGTITSVTIPSTILYYGTDGNGYNQAFDNQSRPGAKLSRLLLVNGLTSIGDRMFFHNNALLKVTIPSTVTSIGNAAFGYCPSLSQITLINGLTVIGQQMFISADGGDFNPSNITSIEIPSTVTTIGYRAFDSCSSLSQFIMVNGLTVTGAQMFGDRDLMGVLKVVTIPSSITSIGSWAFRSCSAISQVVFISGLSVIGESMFYMGIGRSTVLSSVTIPSTVTSIGSQAFAYLTALKCVSWVGTTITSPTDIFKGTPSSSQACIVSSSIVSTTVPFLSPTVTPSVTKSLNNPSFKAISTPTPTITSTEDGSVTNFTPTTIIPSLRRGKKHHNNRKSRKTQKAKHEKKDNYLVNNNNAKQIVTNQYFIGVPIKD